ncbi:unnamed protein product, partial [Pocillopora meandrina]
VRYVSSSKVIFDLSSAELTSYISLKAKMIYVGAFSTVKARTLCWATKNEIVALCGERVPDIPVEKLQSQRFCPDTDKINISYNG